MRIISRFHDYYDVGMKLGMDNSILYKRDKTVVFGIYPIDSIHNSFGWHSYVLAFCGKFYPFVFYVSDDGKLDKILWDVEEAVATLPKKKWRFYMNEDNIESELGIRRFFDRKYPNLDKIFYEYKTPIFGFGPPPTKFYSWMPLKDYTSLVLNPSLKDIQFYKTKDPITAFQEIQMYLSGVLGSNGPEPLPISDKLKAQAHGHDHKYSFKRSPGEPKRRKKRNGQQRTN